MKRRDGRKRAFSLAQAFTPGEERPANHSLFPLSPLQGTQRGLLDAAIRRRTDPRPLKGTKRDGIDRGPRFPGVNAWASERGRMIDAEGRWRRHAAYTLLEVILALALATVLLGLIGMAMHIHLGVAEKSRGQVEEAQLARGLLQRIADDLRNSVPFTPTSGTSTTSATSGQSTVGTSTTSGTSTAGGTSTTSDSDTSIPAGISGTTRCSADGHDPSRAADRHGDARQRRSGKLIAAGRRENGDVQPGRSGHRHSAATRRRIIWGRIVSPRDRSACLRRRDATGSVRYSDPNHEQARPEVVNVQFTYYASSTTSEQWDSNTDGGLPGAIMVAITIRRAGAKSPLPAAAAATDNSSFTAYDMLVDLPNSQVQSSQSSGQSAGTSSGGTATQPTVPTGAVVPFNHEPGKYQPGKNAQPGKEGQPGNRGGGNRGGGNRGGGTRGGGTRGGGTRGGGTRGGENGGGGNGGGGNGGGGNGGGGNRGSGNGGPGN